MPKTILERLQRFAMSQSCREHTLCPRCGKDAMKPALHSNALSRYADILICDRCGMDEAKMAYMGAPMPLAHWACLNPPRDDLKDTPKDEALHRIEQEHIPYLKELFHRWMTQHTGVDWEAQRLDAYDMCPGLTTLWFEPFVAKYTVAEGVLTISFRMRDGTVQYVADLIPE